MLSRIKGVTLRDRDRSDGIRRGCFGMETFCRWMKKIWWSRRWRWYEGKRKTKNEVDGPHQAWHEQVRFEGRRRPRQEKMEEDCTQPLPGIWAGDSKVLTYRVHFILMKCRIFWDCTLYWDFFAGLKMFLCTRTMVHLPAITPVDVMEKVSFLVAAS